MESIVGTLLAEKTDKTALFKKYIILILTYVYENSPSAVRFDQGLIEALTGYKYKSDDEEKIEMFLETIDFLSREGYIRCAHDHVSPSSLSDQKYIQFSIPIFISQKGINCLEKITNTGAERFIDKFKKFSAGIIGKTAEKVLIDELVGNVSSFLNQA